MSTLAASLFPARAIIATFPDRTSSAALTHTMIRVRSSTSRWRESRGGDPSTAHLTTTPSSARIKSHVIFISIHPTYVNRGFIPSGMAISLSITITGPSVNMSLITCVVIHSTNFTALPPGNTMRPSVPVTFILRDSPS